MRRTFLVIGLLLLFAIEILRVYFIMPFPGSQRSNTIEIAWFLNKNIFSLRILALVMTVPPLFYYLQRGRTWQKLSLTGLVLLYGFIFYLFNFRFLADKMFYQPKEKLFADASADITEKGKLIIGVAIKGEARAYPIEIIGYHHQVRDTVGGQSILVTYCTVCRTGRVYSPIVKGRLDSFRLVGMDHFNAMFEDARTGSWWQQATGMAITGPLKGARLAEIPSAQMSLSDWQSLHPHSLTLQPDPHFQAKYDSLKGYDEGTIKGSLERRDTGSWKFKSWVIGIRLNGQTKAYDWNRLVHQRFIQDTIGDSAILLTILPDDKTFFALTYPGTPRFYYDSATQSLKDEPTQSTWQADGECIKGRLKGEKLVAIQAYQEFWHSWKTFHPMTTGDVTSLP